MYQNEDHTHTSGLAGSHSAPRLEKRQRTGCYRETKETIRTSILARARQTMTRTQNRLLTTESGSTLPLHPHECRGSCCTHGRKRTHGVTPLLQLRIPGSQVGIRHISGCDYAFGTFLGAFGSSHWDQRYCARE